jgi:two-component system chemotaxis response regulator CheY
VSAVLAGSLSWERIMKRCLVVDDSDVIRRVARRILESLGFQIQEAENGQKALELCGQAMPEFILLDWHMPGMGAMDLLRALRRTADDNKAYIVYCMTENDREDISRALEAGADDYLLKPFERESLSAKFARNAQGVILGTRSV